MDIETAINGIRDWFDGEASFEIGPLVDEAKGTSEEWDQSETFLSVSGEQYSVGMEGDSFEGTVYFEYAPGKYISVHYWM